jgi:5-formyltetrahydrofolate cyclo-ligase
LKIQEVVPKSEARKIVLERRREHSELELRKKTFEIINNLSSSEEFALSKTIHTYIASREGEVDTQLLIDRMISWGKAVVVPKLNPKTKSFRRFFFTGWDDIIKNEEGYSEPKIGLDDDLRDVDLVLVPVLAVTKDGHRIGYGGGYYDKLLSQINCPKIALAFEFQLFRNIEVSRSDVKMDKIITERRVIDTSNSQFHPAGQ